MQKHHITARRFSILIMSLSVIAVLFSACGTAKNNEPKQMSPLKIVEKKSLKKIIQEKAVPLGKERYKKIYPAMTTEEMEIRHAIRKLMEEPNVFNDVLAEIKAEGKPPENELDCSYFTEAVAIASKKGMESDLRFLLKLYCPDSTHSEFVLAYSKVDKAFFILFDIFNDRQIDAKNRERAFEVIKRAFYQSYNEKMSDADFVISCERWLTENFKKAKVNTERYQFMVNAPPAFPGAEYRNLYFIEEDSDPLFEK
jgi:hypothetical protein